MLRRNFINSIAVGSSIAIMPNEKILNYNSENKFNLIETIKILRTGSEMGENKQS